MSLKTFDPDACRASDRSGVLVIRAGDSASAARTSAVATAQSHAQKRFTCKNTIQSPAQKRFSCKNTILLTRVIVGDCWYYSERKEHFVFTTNNHPQSPRQKSLCFDKRQATRAGDCAMCRDHPAMSMGFLQWKRIWGGRTCPSLCLARSSSSFLTSCSLQRS